MAKFPAEIFGHHWQATDDKAKIDRERRWCPFVDKICYKRSRLLGYPFGVCSVQIGEQIIAICPRRFLEAHRVFRDIAEHRFHTTDNILVFAEVGLKSVGTFDFVMVRHKPMSSEIEDFAIIEFQTGSTSNTGPLVRAFQDFMENGVPVGEHSYAFGMTIYDIWKRTFTQILKKGVILENWGHKIYWVVQERVYRDLESRYKLQSIGFHDNHATIFALYDLKLESGGVRLVPTRFTSASIDDLFRAFRHNPDIPPVDDFLEKLRAKMAAELQIRLAFTSKTPH